MENEVRELQMYFCPFGYLDIQAACNIGDEVGLYESDLFEIIDDYKENCGYSDYDHIDPVYCVLEHILQMARNEIVSVAGYDFINEYSGAGSEIYTYGNFMCSSYDYSEEALSELKETLEPYFEQLANDKWCSYLFSELEIGAE